MMIGDGGKVSFAQPVNEVKGTPYAGSIAKIDSLFEKNADLQLKIGQYTVKAESGKIKIYKDGQEETGKNIQDVLIEVFGRDKAPYILNGVLIAFNALNLNDKTVDVEKLYKEVKTEVEKLKDKSPKDVNAKAAEIVTQGKIQAMQAAAEPAPVPAAPAKELAPAVAAPVAAPPVAPPPPAAFDANVIPPGFRRVTVKYEGNTCYVDYKDEDKSETMGKAELKTAVILDATGKEIGKLSDNFALFIDRHGDWETRGEDKEISDAELQDVIGVVVSLYAKELKMDYAKALSAYNNAKTFRNVRISELSETRIEATGWLNGVDLKDETAVRKALNGKLSNALTEIVIAYISNNKDKKDAKPIDGSDVASYLLRCSMATMTGVYDEYGVTEDIFKNMPNFDPKEVTKNKFMAWFRGENVNGEEESGNKEVELLRKKQNARVGIQDASTAADAVKKYEEARAILGEDNDAIRIIVEKYLGEEKYEEAIKFADKLPPALKKKCFADVIQTKQKAFVDKANSSDLSGAKVEIEALKSLIDKMGVERKEYLNEFYKASFQLALKYAEKGDKSAAYALIGALPEDVEIGFKDGDSLKNLSVLEARFMIAEKLSDNEPMQKIIDDTNASKTKKAKALASKARIKLNQAKKTADSSLYKKAFESFKKAWESIKTETDSQSTELSGRLDQEMTEVQRLVDEKASSMTTRTSRSQENEWIKLGEDLRKMRAGQQVAEAKPAKKGRGKTVNQEIDDILSSSNNREKKVSDFITALSKLRGKTISEVTAILHKVRTAGFNVNPITSSEGKITQVNVS
ncbi:MAG: hypothetical protein ABIH50_06625 [bacterium]